MHELQCLNVNRYSEYIPSTEILTKIVDALPIGIIQFDNDNKIVQISKKCNIILKKNLTLGKI